MNIKKLQVDLERKIQSLETILEFSRSISTASTLKNIYDAIMLTCMGQKGIEITGLLLKEVDSEVTFKIEAIRGADGVVRGQFVDFPKTLLQDFGEEKYLKITEIALTEGHEATKKILENLDCYLLIPLFYHKKLIGLLSCSHRITYYDYHDEDIEFLKLITNHAGVAINNVMMVEDLERNNINLEKRIYELNIIEEINRTLVSSLDVKGVCHTLILTVMGYLISESGAFFINSPEEPENFKLISQVGDSLSLPSDMFSMKADFVEKIAGFQVIHKDKEEQEPISKLLLRMEMEICFPIKVSDSLFAFCFFGYKATGLPYKENELKLALLMIQQAIFPIRNSMMYQEIEQRVIERTVQLEIANRAKSEFLANMSHEIRTPLNAILGFSQIMSSDQNLSFQQKDQLATINRSGEYLLGLINDILEISKIEAGRMVINPIDFDLEAMIKDLEQMFKVRAEAKQLILSMEIAKDTPRFLRGDEAKMRQIYINLIGNSIKFTPEGSISLWVSSVSNQDSGLRLITEVRDTGVGIAEEEQSSLFECFEQTSSGINSGGGTGLGLAISQRYTIMMGGEITVESEVGKGSLFRVEVNLEVGDEKGIKTMQKHKETGIRTGEDRNRILIVDDIEENRKVLKLMLEKVGFITKEAFNGVGAVETFTDWHPHLVLMDIRMPVMDGYEATRRIKAMEGGAKIPVVAITASAFDGEREEVIAAGVDGFIAKPFRENELFHVIGSLLNIEYTYADDEIENGPVENTVSDLLPEAIAALPQDLLAELRQVLESADLDNMLELIDRIENHDEKTAAILKGMAQRYEYESLLNILS